MSRLQPDSTASSPSPISSPSPARDGNTNDSLRHVVDLWALMYADWYAHNALKLVWQLRGWKDVMMPVWDGEPVSISPLQAFVVFDAIEDIPYSVYIELRNGANRDELMEDYALCIQDRRVLSGAVAPIGPEDIGHLLSQYLQSHENRGGRRSTRRRLHR